MFMEPHASDWHLIGLVVRNFGQTAAHNISFDFTNHPTVAIYEDSDHDGELDVTELRLPSELSILAPGQEWRTVWDSAISRGLGGSIRSRFEGTLTYYDMPAPAQGRSRGSGASLASSSPRRCSTGHRAAAGAAVGAVDGHDLAKREKQKLELLRSVLTYFHYASKETQPDVFRARSTG